jgi:hypothetical protein
MNNMKVIKLLVSISVLIFVLNSCGKDPVEPPCECGQKPVSANFTITETSGSPQSMIQRFEPYDTDTLMFGDAVFTALEENANYKWLIGIETLNDKIVERSGFPLGETVPITLVVEKEPDNDCFPNDDGKDTLTRFLYKAESSCESLIHGNYHGALTSNPQDTFTISIDNCAPYPDINGQPSGSLVISNLKRDCIFKAFEFVISHKQIVCWGILCDSPIVKIYVSDTNNDDIEIKFMYQTGDDKDKEFIFKGTKK